MDKDTKGGKAQVEAGCVTLLACEHQAKQLANWSSTPDHDVACVRFAVEVLAPVCQKFHIAVQAKGSVSADFVPDVELVRGSASL
eukprot:1141380-Alexandrium_andersonii.AAC.1